MRDEYIINGMYDIFMVYDCVCVCECVSECACAEPVVTSQAISRSYRWRAEQPFSYVCLTFQFDRNQSRWTCFQFLVYRHEFVTNQCNLFRFFPDTYCNYSMSKLVGGLSCLYCFFSATFYFKSGNTCFHLGF